MPGKHNLLAYSCQNLGQSLFLVSIWYYCAWFEQFYRKFKYPGGSKSFLAVFLEWKNLVLFLISNWKLQIITWKLYVLIMSRTRFRVNPHSIVNVKQLLAPNRRKIWSLSDCSRARTHNYLARKQTLNHVAKMVFYWIINIELLYHIYACDLYRFFCYANFFPFWVFWS